MAEVVGRCLACQQPVQDADLTCPGCGAGTRVDAFWQSLPGDDKARHTAAKALAGLGPPAPALLRVKELQARPELPVLAGVTPSFARRAVEAVGEAGASLELRPHRASRRLPPVALAGGAAALVAAGLGYQVLRRPAPTPVPVAPTAAVAPAAPAPPAATTFELPGASTAAVACGDQTAVGFFLDKETLVAPALPCRPDELARVTLGDGRTLVGASPAVEAWQGVARWRVVGAEARPLAVGDATQLQAGEVVSYVDLAEGARPALRPSRVADPALASWGLSYLALDAPEAPRALGGPLLNARGELVGFLVSGEGEAAGRAWALPIPYLVAPADPVAEGKWKARLASVDQAAQVELERWSASLRLPRLVGASPSEPALVMAEAAGGAEASRSFGVWVKDEFRCSLGASLKRGATLAEALAVAPDSRLLRWLSHQGKSGAWTFTLATLTSSSCDGRNRQLTHARLTYPAQGVVSSEVELSGAALAKALALPADAAPLAKAPEPAPGAQAGAVPVYTIHFDVPGAPASPADGGGTAPAPEAGPSLEASWRERFRKARADLAARLQEIDGAQAELDRIAGEVRREMDMEAANAGIQGVARPFVLGGKRQARVDYLKDLVDNADRYRAEAQARFHDLEVEASRDAVPLEWRK